MHSLAECIKDLEPVFLALYHSRIDQHRKVSITSKAFLDLDQPDWFQKRNTSPWCLLPQALSSDSNSLFRRSNKQRSLTTVLISWLFIHKVPHTEKQYFYFSFLLLLQLRKVRETVGSKMKAYISCGFFFIAAYWLAKYCHFQYHKDGMDNLQGSLCRDWSLWIFFFFHLGELLAIYGTDIDNKI